MATGVLGGNPTVTKRTFNWTTNVTNFTVYTCPANTISYLTVDSFAASSGTAIVTNVSGVGCGHSGSYGTLRDFFTNSAGAAFSQGLLQTTPSNVNITIPNTSFMARRIENPIVSPTANFYYGQVILMPNEFLWITTTNVAGGRTYEMNYSTLEIQSGS